MTGLDWKSETCRRSSTLAKGEWELRLIDISGATDTIGASLFYKGAYRLFWVHGSQFTVGSGRVPAHYEHSIAQQDRFVHVVGDKHNGHLQGAAFASA